MGTAYLRTVVRRPWIVVAVVALATGGALVPIAHLGFEDSIEMWFIESDPALRAYDRFREEFTNDEYVIAAYTTPDGLVGPETIAVTERMTRELESLDAVAKVTSITSVEDIGTAGDALRVEPLVRTSASLPEQRRAAAKLVGDRLYAGRLASADGTVAVISAKLHPHRGSGIDEREAIVAAIENVLQRNGVEYRLTGAYAWDIAFFMALVRDQTVLLPIMVAVFLVVLGLMFRSLVGILLPTLTVASAVLWTFALLSLTIHDLTVVTGMLPVVLLAIGVADSVHFIAEYQEELALGRGKHDAVVAAGRTVFAPCLFTSVTTALGFLGLLVIEVEPLRVFGVFAALGTMLAFLSTYTLVPAVLSLAPLPETATAAAPGAVVRPGGLAGLFGFVARHRSAMLASSIVVFGVGAAGLPQVHTSVNFYKYLDADTPIIDSTDFIEDRVGGISYIEILVRPRHAAAHAEPIKEIEALRDLDLLQSTLEESPGVQQTVSVVDFVKTMSRAMAGGDSGEYRLPDSRAAAAQLLLMYEMDAPDGDLYDFVNFDFSAARMMARTRLSDAERHAGIIAEVQRAGNELAHVSVQPTGAMTLFTHMEHHLLTGMVRGFSVAFVAVAIVIMLLLRSIKHGLLAMIPAAVPVVVVIGMTGWFGMAITSMPAMMGNVALGVAVDNAIHILTRYRRMRYQGVPPEQAIGYSVTVVGRPVLYTTIVLCLGFTVLVFSEMVPGRAFGILTMGTLTCSLLASLVTLPATVLVADARLAARRGIAPQRSTEVIKPDGTAAPSIET